MGATSNDAQLVRSPYRDALDSRIDGPVPNAPTLVKPSAIEPRPCFRWNIDEVSDNEVSGWIMEIEQPLHHPVVELREGDRVLAQTIASRFRPDLLEAGIGDGCCAFRLEMPQSLLDGREHLLEIAEKDTRFPLAPEPIQWRSTAGTAGAVLTGFDGTMEDAGANSVTRLLEAKAERTSIARRAGYDTIRSLSVRDRKTAASGNQSFPAAVHVGTRMLVDISDLGLLHCRAFESYRDPAGPVEHRPFHD